MTQAADIMTREVVVVTPETEIAEAARILIEKRFNGLPVVDRSGRLVGIICQSDLVAMQKKVPLPSVFTLLDSLVPIKSAKEMERDLKRIAAAKVADAMTANPMTVPPTAELEDIATLMATKNLHTLPVVDQGKLVGIIGMEDILRTLMPRSGPRQTT